MSGTGIATSALFSSCASLPVFRTTVKDGIILVPQSVLNNGNIHIISVGNFLYDIALKKEESGKYIAYSLLCTHASNPLACTGDQFICSLHGSKFDFEGNVVRGPAAKPLTQFQIRVTPDFIIIYP